MAIIMIKIAKLSKYPNKYPIKINMEKNIKKISMCISLKIKNVNPILNPSKINSNII